METVLSRRRRTETTQPEEEPSLHETAAQRQELFNRIAHVYDNLNDLFSLGLHRLWKRWTVSWSGVKEGDKVLDVCCGSGDLSFLLSEKVGVNGKVIGLDFSKELLKISENRQLNCQRKKPCYKNIEWVNGDALELPYPDSTFDAATIGFGLRNIVDRTKSLEEIVRVLKPGAKVAILDFNKSTSKIFTKIKDFLIVYVIAPFASLFGLAKEYRYLKKSIYDYYTGNELEKLALEAGFSESKFYEIGAGLVGVLVAKR